MAMIHPIHQFYHPSFQNLPLSKETSTKPASLSSSSSPYSSTNTLKSLDSVKAVHAQMIKQVEDSSKTKMQSLIVSYLNFNDFISAATLFIVAFAEIHLNWNYFSKEFYNHGGDLHEALRIFSDFRNRGMYYYESNVLALPLEMCSNSSDVLLGTAIHAYMIKKGIDMDVNSNRSLMNFYGRCFSVDIANQLFDEMPLKETSLFKEAILMNLKYENWLQAITLFRYMQFSYMKPNSFLIARILQACQKLEALDEGKQIHGYMIRTCLESNISFNSLIYIYSRNGNLDIARAVFDSMEDRDSSSWNSIISGYIESRDLNTARNLFLDMELSDVKPDIVTWNCILSGHSHLGFSMEVLEIFRKMQAVGFKPNSNSVTSALQSTSNLGFLSIGREIHSYAIRNGIDSDQFVGTALIDMYAKNHKLMDARKTFNSMKKNRNIFTWNSLISGYSFNGQFDKAVELLNSMRNEVEPDLVTYNSMVSGYAMWGYNKEAIDTIQTIKLVGLNPNVVTWTALISGCVQREDYVNAIQFAIKMNQERIKPNSVTLSTLLRACSGLSLLNKGKEIHCITLRDGSFIDKSVATALIDMYSKCGSLRAAIDVFRRIPNQPPLAAWNSMIMGFAIYSRADEARQLFDEMLEEGIEPDSITFTAILSSCKHAGLVNEGWDYFDRMKSEFNIIPKIEHYSCMVDLLGRAGYLDEAADFIQKMPMAPDGSVWGALLRSCRNHENLELAEIAARKLFKIEPNNAANYAILSSIYASLSKWDDVDSMRDLTESIGMRHGLVWSWIEIDQMVHVFDSGKKTHREEGMIYFELDRIISEIMAMGYKPDLNCVHQDVDDFEKENLVMSHTEKLAIVYGLIKENGSIPIRVIKNTRVCSDCHTFAKYVSILRRREIVVKDGSNRFHHFKDGKCLCQDFW
ncbi:pentatricopeptide repeat-containing protein At4g01030, mitochondrial [Impatiens glandulifera]|uniref:pentatricopeptide repeat-containing protein At4g01030, mitochondrial n=1 Tax=Impatiens glandulifera TaxID=253017 RepID=UPI001FB1488E|nr:pentatricopeptide repeat-containing protein At4g01030, mitochondrial [Impatiens glandulifera]